MFFDRPRAPFAALITFLCRACFVTPLLTRAIIGPFSAYPEKISLHDLGVTWRHDLGAAIGPLHFLRPPTQHVIEVGAGKADSAFCGQAEALFGAALVLELGHFAIPDT